MTKTSSHAANVGKSARLQRVLQLLQQGGEYSTLDIVQAAQVCAVNSIIHELRENGYSIACRQQVTDGRRLFFYSLVQDAA